MIQVGDRVQWNAKSWVHGVATETPMTGVVESVYTESAIVRPEGNRKQRRAVPLEKLTVIPNAT